MPTSSMPNPAVAARVPFGVPAFDLASGGVPLGCVSLLVGQSQTARWAACYAFSNALNGIGVPPAVISPADPAQWAEVTKASGAASKAADVRFLHVAKHSLTPQLAREAWMEMLPTLAECRNGRVSFCSAWPWLSFVPERSMGEYVAAFVGALDELCSDVLLVLPEPTSPRADVLIRHLEAVCPVVIRLEAGDQANVVRWTTRRLDGSSALPVLDLAEADLRELPKRAAVPDEPVKKSERVKNKPTIQLDYARLMGMASETKNGLVTPNERGAHP